MKYKVLYDTQIAGKFLAKDEILDFKNGTDESFINRLVANKVIQKVASKESAKPQDEAVDSPNNEDNDAEAVDTQKVASKESLKPQDEAVDSPNNDDNDAKAVDIQKVASKESAKKGKK